MVKLDARTRAMLRGVKTRASTKFTAGGLLRKEAPRPITLAKIKGEVKRGRLSCRDGS